MRHIENMKNITSIALRLLGAPALVLVLVSSSGCQTKQPADAGLSILFQVKIRTDYDIYRLRTEGAYPDSVVVLPGDAVLPIWSPDRSKFVFSHFRDGHFDIAIANADGSNRRYLTADTADDVNIASFFPLGNRVVFSTNRNGNLDLYTVNVDGTGLAPLVTDSSNEWHPIVTPNGQLVVFSSDRTGIPRLWVLDIVSRKQQSVMPPDTMTAEFEPCISPDARFLAFSLVTRGKDPKNFDIAVYDLVEKTARVVIDDPAMDRWPRFSRDGKKILFFSNRTGTNALYVYDRVARTTRALNTGTVNSSFGDW